MYVKRTFHVKPNRVHDVMQWVNNAHSATETTNKHTHTHISIYNTQIHVYTHIMNRFEHEIFRFEQSDQSAIFEVRKQGKKKLVQWLSDLVQHVI